MPARTIFTLLILVTGFCSVVADAATPPKPPFKVLFSNDTTNITSCISPYHAKGEDITDDMIRATVDEATAVDVHMLLSLIHI